MIKVKQVYDEQQQGAASPRTGEFRLRGEKETSWLLWCIFKSLATLLLKK